MFNPPNKHSNHQGNILFLCKNSSEDTYQTLDDFMICGKKKNKKQSNSSQNNTGAASNKVIFSSPFLSLFVIAKEDNHDFLKLDVAGSETKLLL